MFSLAHILYGILTGKKPFQDTPTQMKRRIIAGQKPSILEQFITDDADKLLLDMMNRAYIMNPTERISASEVVLYLEAFLDKAGQKFLRH